MRRLLTLTFRRIPLATVLMIVFTCVIGATAFAAPDPYFSVNVQSTVNYLRPDAAVPAGDTTRPIGNVPAVSLDPADRWSMLFAQAAADGVGTARVDAPWKWVEPTAPSGDRHTYVWNTNEGSAQLPRYKNLDNAIGHLALAGIRAMPVLDYAPVWAQVDLGKPGAPWYGNPYAPPTAAEYGNFAAYARALARRYGPAVGGCSANTVSFWCSDTWLRTGRPAMPITTYEVWNEENHVFNWPPAVNADAYVDMFNQVRAGIRAADADAKVVIGGIVWNDAAAFIADLFAGGPAFANGGPDGVAIHPYGPTPYSVLANTHVAATALANAGQGALPIYQTELGWPRWDPSMASPVSSHAAIPFASDRARAGTMALVTDAMSTSDCPIAGFSAYTLAERESGEREVAYDGFSNDPTNAEQWMGLYGRDDGARTLEAQAYAQSIATRGSPAMAPYRAPICGTTDVNAAPSPSPPLLPLSITARAASDRCISAQVSYRGWPIEEAFVHAIPAVGDAVTVPTDAEGNADLCVAAASTSIGVIANVPYAALSPTVTVGCSVDPGGCPAPPPEADPPQGPPRDPPEPDEPSCGLASAAVAVSKPRGTMPKTATLTMRLRGVGKRGCRVKLKLDLAKRSKSGKLTPGTTLGKANVVVKRTAPPKLTLKLSSSGRAALHKSKARTLNGFATVTTNNAGRKATTARKAVKITAKAAGRKRSS